MRFPTLLAALAIAVSVAGCNIMPIHNVDQGGANGLGPNLWATVGKPHASHPGFAYSEALKGKAGAWDWDGLNAWFKSPKAYAAGTKMAFAGVSKPEDRASLLVYLNSKSDSPLPLPAAPAETAAAEAAPAETAPTDAAPCAGILT